MRQHRRTVFGRSLLVLFAPYLIGLVSGCASPPPIPMPAASLSFAQDRLPSKTAPSNGDGPIRQVSFSKPANLPASTVSASPFGASAELTAEQVVSEVLTRNPTIAQMTAAWQAASARYPQVTSLDDPRFGASFAPASIDRPHMDFGYSLEVSQAFPYPGKRQLRGQAALHTAAAAGAEVDDVRLQLSEAARIAFAEYYLAVRANDVNEENLRLLKEFRQNALSRFRTGQTSQQDVLQADVALARQGERAVILERQKKVAQARINTLLHLSPDSPLPPPLKELPSTGPLPPVTDLRARAAQGRPDVAALEQKIASEQAAVALALKEYYPDFEAIAAYNQMWAETEMRPMIGIRMNLPTRLRRRDAATAEAQARVAQRQAELARLVDQIHFQVQEAYEQSVESERVLKLYEQTTLPTARDNVKLAQSEYTVGRIPFLTLIEAQRELVGLRDRYFEVLAESLRRRAALERAVGATIAAPPTPALTPSEPKKATDSGSSANS